MNEQDTDQEAQQEIAKKSPQESKQETRQKSALKQRTALHGLILWIIALSAIYFGYQLSVEQFLDQDWLARAGCFIVILGIWSGLGGVIEAKLMHRALTLKKNIALRQINRAFGADEDERENQMQNIRHHYEEQFELLRSNLGISVGVIEASLLITGTLFWGFGDLIKYVI